MSQYCLAGRYVRNLFARGRGHNGAMKRRAGRKRSRRCTINCHEGRLRRGGIGQSVQGQGASYLYVRMSQCCLAGLNVRNLFARGCGQNGALNGRGVCALGVARAQVDDPQFVMRALFEEAALEVCTRARRIFSFWENFAWLARRTKCSRSCCQKS